MTAVLVLLENLADGTQSVKLHFFLTSSALGDIEKGQNHLCVKKLSNMVLIYAITLISLRSKLTHPFFLYDFIRFFIILSHDVEVLASSTMPSIRDM